MGLRADKRFQHTGLERAQRLATDIDWLQHEHGLSAPETASSGPGSEYSACVLAAQDLLRVSAAVSELLASHRLLRELASSDPAAFICHFYNFYFAHTAGGKMIGARVSCSLLLASTRKHACQACTCAQVSSMLLDDAVLEFYKWDGDVKEHLAGVRDNLNEVAEGWTREQKDRCLQETQKCFQVCAQLSQLGCFLCRWLTCGAVLQTSGAILRTIVELPA